MALQIYNKMTHAVRYWLLRKLPTCKQMAPVMSESLDRPLSLRERGLLKLHLWVCIWCVRYLEQLQTLRDGLRVRASQVSSDEPHSDVLLSTEARARITSALNRADR